MQQFMLVADNAGSYAALVTFVVYIAGVMLLAYLSNLVMQSKSFLSEYFLGSRSLGMWAFALTFAATSSSGGSFIGFPALVYTHGWVVALWIGSYMIVPLVSMGLLAKRLNQIARQTGAITIPDVLRNRFESDAIGILSTVLIVFFMTFNLIAQFKGGSVILQTLLADMGWFQSAARSFSPLVQMLPLQGIDAGYVLCLVVFAIAVIVYTTYGGFRAVVWTDVMQGFVMVGGVVLMLPLALWQVGGLENATQKMSAMTPPRQCFVTLKIETPRSDDLHIPAHSWAPVESADGRKQLFRLKPAAIIPAGVRTAVVGDTAPQSPPEPSAAAIAAIEITSPVEVASIQAEALPAGVSLTVLTLKELQGLGVKKGANRLKYGEDTAGVYVTGPGLSYDSVDGFLPLSVAVSFFFMWTFSGAGQPSNMVRLMAFRDSKTLRRAIFTVSIYYTLIYFPLVIIFCCARVLLPGWEIQPDRVMPEMAKLLTVQAGAGWLAGLLVAAPFAAVMSTMDSFLLMISSALVRDVYQRHYRPDASEKQLKRLTYAVTLVTGAAAMLAAVSPPKFLQDIIVFTGSGLSTSFLAVVALGMYWPRFNRSGGMACILGGFCTHIAFYVMGYVLYGKMQPYQPLGFHPFLAGSVCSFIVGISVTLFTAPPEPHLVRKFFYAKP